MDIATIGFDLAKTVFQVHGADAKGRPALRRKLRRGKVLAFFAGLPSCLVGMEACASAHYWAREIQALGHEVRLIPPQYVRPFVKTNKNDAADAEAICEAVTRPTMRFAPAKSAEQQSVLMLHRARELLVRQRTMVINALRGHCAELGLIVAQGASKVEELVAIIEDPGDVRLPPLAREALGSLVEQLRSAQARIKQLRRRFWHGTDPTRRAAVLRRSPASASSPRRRWSRRSEMARSSARAGSSRPGSVSCPGNTRVAARTDWGAYRSAGMAISGACSCMVREPCCAGAARSRVRVPAGPTGSWRGGRQTLSWSPWPIRQPASPGRCSATSVSTNRRRLRH
jgi:transposase